MRRSITAAVTLTVALAACGSGKVEIPAPRPLVIFSGERLLADSARLQEIHDWVMMADDTIQFDPSFLIAYETAPVPSYPWQTFEYTGPDSVRVAYEAAAPDVQTSYGIYAFLHILDEQGRLEDWFPEVAGLEGWELERFIVAQTVDSWLLGRAIFDTHPYGLMDELVYAQDRGYLDAFLLTARADEFSEEKEAFEAANPGRLEEYAEWFETTFRRPPPGADESG